MANLEAVNTSVLTRFSNDMLVKSSELTSAKHGLCTQSRTAVMRTWRENRSAFFISPQIPILKKLRPLWVTLLADKHLCAHLDPKRNDVIRMAFENNSRSSCFTLAAFFGSSQVRQAARAVMRAIQQNPCPPN
jgi:hypothetical protein